MPGRELRCRRCGRGIVRNADRADVFEGMHWTCFHFDFEHSTDDGSDDPDVACGDPSSPARAQDKSGRPTWFEAPDLPRPWHDRKDQFPSR